MSAIAQMRKNVREKAIRSAVELNEQSCELGNVVERFLANEGGPNKEIAENLAGFANSFAYEVRERILELVKANLGVRQQKNLMLVLRKTGEWVDAERAELQRAPERFSGLRIVTPETARSLRDLDEFDKFLRVLAKDILRAMADYNFRKRVSKSDG